MSFLANGPVDLGGEGTLPDDGNLHLRHHYILSRVLLYVQYYTVYMHILRKLKNCIL